jgi:hypothetical protein
MAKSKGQTIQWPKVKGQTDNTMAKSKGQTDNTMAKSKGQTDNTMAKSKGTDRQYNGQK